MSLLYATHSAAIKRWVSLHPEIEFDSNYVIRYEEIIEILIKNADADSESSGTGAIVHCDQLPVTLHDILEKRGKQAFGHAVRRHFTGKLTLSTKSYFRIDVGLIGSPPHEVTKCLILIHTDHPPR